MALMDFIKKQFIDIIQWTETGDGTLAWRFPMQDMEIQNGASLTVRESQVALFVNEGQVADVFGPGMYKLTTQTLPVLTYLKNWDKLFQSPFKSDVYFFSTRQQIDQRWGTTQPVTIRDKDFGVVRLRANGKFAFRVKDSVKLLDELVGTQGKYTTDDVTSYLKDLIVSRLTDLLASQQTSLLDLPSQFDELSSGATSKIGQEFGKYGLELVEFFINAISPPEEVQKAIDARSSMGAIGDMQAYTVYQAANSMRTMAEQGGAGGTAAAPMGMGMGAGFGMMRLPTIQRAVEAAAEREAEHRQPSRDPL